MKKIYIMMLSLSVAACSIDDAEYSDVVELVAKQQEDELLVPSDGGKVDVEIFSNGRVEVLIMNDIGDWAQVENLSFEGDDTVKVKFTPNEGFRRMVKLQMTLDGGTRTQTLRIRQEGIIPFIECASPFATVDGSQGGQVVFSVKTNIPKEEISYSKEYVSGQKDWLSDVRAEDMEIRANAGKNPLGDIARAVLTASYTDGWEETFKLKLFVTLSDKDGRLGTPMDFTQARQFAGNGPVTSDSYIEGVVVSDFHSENMELNPSVNYDKVDVSVSRRTAYLQSMDGSAGYRLVFEDEADNVLVFGTCLAISLKGAEVVLEESPARYTIRGLKAGNMVSSRSGSVEPKLRRIAELTDADIYTYVEIPNTEFVNKAGAYANVYENYTLASSVNECLVGIPSGNNNRLDGWAALLADDQANTIYAPVNMLCEWRRSGNGVPQGNGSVKGVIVHNDMSRYGDLGKYQIRVIDESGFCQEREGNSSWRTVAEWDGAPYHYRYGLYSSINSRYADPGAGKRGNSIIPSDDVSTSSMVARAEITFENKTVGASAGGYPISSFEAYTAKVVTASGYGNRGIASASSTDEEPRSMCLNNEIKGWFKWKDNEVTGYNGVVINLSTEDLQGEYLAVYYAFSAGKRSAATSQNFPAHWCLEYSVDGGDFIVCPDSCTGKEYVHLRTLPWWDANLGGIKYYTSSSCGLGATEHLCKLPSEVLGREKLTIRIRPYDTVMSVFPIVWNADVETSRVKHNTTANTVINFENISIFVK